MSRARPPLVLLQRPDRPLIVSYAHWWRLPPPLPPRRLPLVRLGLVLAVIGVALLAGLVEPWQVNRKSAHRHHAVPDPKECATVA